MKILNVSDYTQHLNEMAAVTKTAEEIGDFFRALEMKKGTIAYIYYGNDFTPYLPKKIELNGVKQPNPMLGRIYKLSSYRFQAGLEYYERLGQLFPDFDLDPNAPINQENRRRSGWISMPDPAKPCQQNEKTLEVALPIVEPKTVWSQWVMIDDTGKPVAVEYADVQPYMKPPKPDTASENTNHVDYKRFCVNKIYMLNGGGKTWPNKFTFMYPFLAPFFKKQF